MENIQNLLNQVAIISKKNEEILDATGSRFNMFRLCGVDHNENTHSAIIAELLRPDGTHGLKTKFLESFINMFCDLPALKQSFDIENARATLERSTGDGRLDILIEDRKNHAIIIENKIDAGDQEKQLKRYNLFAEDKYGKGNYQIVYLTLRGKEASEQSGKGVVYTCISYEKDIIAWLEKCVGIAIHVPIVRETINQYINHLKSLTNQDMDTKNKEEILEILSKTENIKTVQLIHQNYNAIFDKLAKNYFNPKMEEFARQKELKYEYAKSNESHIEFYIKSSTWQEKYWIEFTYDSRGYFYGLVNNPQNQISNEAKKRILEYYGKSGKTTDDFPFLKIFDRLDVNTWINDIVIGNKFFDDCKTKIEELLSVMEGVKF